MVGKKDCQKGKKVSVATNVAMKKVAIKKQKKKKITAVLSDPEHRFNGESKQHTMRIATVRKIEIQRMTVDVEINVGFKNNIYL